MKTIVFGLFILTTLLLSMSIIANASNVMQVSKQFVIRNWKGEVLVNYIEEELGEEKIDIEIEEETNLEIEEPNEDTHIETVIDTDYVEQEVLPPVEDDDTTMIDVLEDDEMAGCNVKSRVIIVASVMLLVQLLKMVGLSSKHY